MRILFIGDIVGKPGRKIVAQALPGLRQRERLDLVIANAENAAAGFGITREIGDELLERGVDTLVLDSASDVGASPRDWGHVRLFSPWRWPFDVRWLRFFNMVR